ncbi:MAG: hypothetical protein ABSE16_05215 [Verrucomicrobiota bacterium]|jgi:hypothetical protein
MDETKDAPAAAQAAPDPPATQTPAEVLTPEVSFLRGLVARVGEFLRNDKAKLTGPARLVAELLDRRGVPICSKATADKISAWESEWQRLQKIVNDHDVFAAARAFTSQQDGLAAKITSPAEHGNNQVLSRAALEEKFLLTRESAKQSQQKLFAANIQIARGLAEIAAEILAEHAVTLEASERSRCESYGLPYQGSALVDAVRRARESVLGRVQAGTGQAPPSLLMPWLIL